MKGDGNWFYRCVANKLYGAENEHVAIREAVVKYMQSNELLYSSLVDGEYQKQSKSDENYRKL